MSAAAMCVCGGACQNSRNFFHYKFKVCRDGTKVELPEHCITWDIAITIASAELYHLSINTPKPQQSLTHRLWEVVIQMYNRSVLCCHLATVSSHFCVQAAMFWMAFWKCAQYGQWLMVALSPSHSPSMFLVFKPMSLLGNISQKMMCVCGWEITFGDRLPCRMQVYSDGASVAHSDGLDCCPLFFHVR